MFYVRFRQASNSSQSLFTSHSSGCVYAFSVGKCLYAPLFISVLSSLSTLTVAYAERRTHAHRTSYACTPNVVRTYTERRTSPLLPDGKAGMMLRKPQTRRFPVSLKLYGEKSEGTRMKKTPIRLPLPRHKREALDGFKLVELIIVKNGAEEFCVVVITRSDAEKLCYFGI